MKPLFQERLEHMRIRRRVVILLVFVAIFALLIFAFRAVLVPFLVALFFGYLIAPVVYRMAELRIYRGARLGRGASILILYAILLFTVGLGARFAIPQLQAQIDQVRQDLPEAQAWLQSKAQWLADKARTTFAGTRTEPGPIPLPSASGPKEKGRVRLFLKGGGEKVGYVLDEDEGTLFLRIGGSVEPIPASTVERREPIARVRVVLRPEEGKEADPPRELRGEILARRPGRITVDTGAEVVTVDERQVAEEQLLSEITEEAAVDVKLAIAHAFESLLRNIEQVLTLALSVASWVAKALYEVFLVLMLTAFLVIDGDKIIGFIRSVPPERHRGTIQRLTLYIDRGLAGVIRGQLMICLVNGILTWLGLQFLGVRYSLVLGLLAGVMSLIPIFGTILSTAPIVLIAWGTSGWQKAFFSLGWILLIHFIEANFLNPKIMGAASKIHPVVIIFALLAGESTYGIVGALLAVPAVSILQSLFRFYVLDHQAEIQETA